LLTTILIICFNHTEWEITSCRCGSFVVFPNYISIRVSWAWIDNILDVSRTIGDEDLWICRAISIWEVLRIVCKLCKVTVSTISWLYALEIIILFSCASWRP
jgi:hypothetical protein